MSQHAMRTAELQKATAQEKVSGSVKAPGPDGRGGVSYYRQVAKAAVDCDHAPRRSSCAVDLSCSVRNGWDAVDARMQRARSLCE